MNMINTAKHGKLAGCRTNAAQFVLEDETVRKLCIRVERKEKRPDRKEFGYACKRKKDFGDALIRHDAFTRA